MIRKHSYTTDFGLNISAVSDSLEDSAGCLYIGGYSFPHRQETLDRTHRHITGQGTCWALLAGVNQ